MAPWITHLRLADRFLNWANETGLDIPKFVFGSVAPDSGVPVGVGKYEPGKEVTHFGRSSGRDYEAFARDHLMTARDNAARSFMCGYLTHLVLDSVWACELLPPIRDGLEGDARMEASMAARDEWINLDIQWLEEHGSFPAWDIIARMEVFEDEYLHIFPQGAFHRLHQRVMTHGAGPSAKMKYKYVSMADMDRMIDIACERIDGIRKWIRA